MRSDKERKHGNGTRIHIFSTLRWHLTFFVFAVMLFSCIITLGLFLLINFVVGFSPLLVLLTFNPTFFILLMLGISTVIGTVLANAFGRYYLRPLKRIIAATKEVKKGNFKVQLKPDGKKEKELPIAPPTTEMGILEESFNEMVRELDGIELFRNDFINNFSHELKTPIVSIRGFARQLQREDLSDEERREYAGIIAEESDRLARLSTSILELSKLENQQILTDKTSFYLDEQIRRCILLYENLWSEKEIEIIPDLEEGTVFSNAELLEHIWKNLLSNAIKFTPAGGTVRVTLRFLEHEIVTVFEDNGMGMTEEVKNHVFEKFYQGDPSHHHAGYGIGLAMAQRATLLCGGSITVESEVGKGSRFTVTLPRESATATVADEEKE